ncbi:cytochrome ubiquinol oxidase subunit I [Agrococcus jejuensis]|uniref:Cytochrome d ubiquinol oxidase subunit I n=1 Tax=Agrococcus jejuensis TaxID=399736 RepID=A0A1G8FUX4_9MICO|nr:cytochrome ubiquinol oxidase subunit I [Agrococcus jejuensis]SDH85925.1 cytochrome d ubiquinol oxidase subunit I [Agrococcus jejuensis]
MDALLTFARVEFGVSAGLHFLFVATTLGLAPMLALLSTAHAATGRSHLARATDHVARLYVVGYGLGIVSGIVVEVQLGLNWSGGPSGAYDAIGTALAIETVLAFFVETSLLGLWLASAGRWPAGVRALLLWGVAVAAYASAAIVLAANGSLHRPEGVAADGALVDPVAMLLNPSGVAATWHVAGASAVVGGFWIAAAAAHLMLRRADFEVARTLVRAGVWQVALGAPVAIVAGFAQFAVARVGATEAEEGAWGLLLALMMLVGVLVLGATWLVMVPMLVRTAIARARWLQRCMVALVWVPLATTLMGWVYREEARQPWFVVGVVRTADAASLAPAWALVPGGLVLMAISIAATVLAWVAMHRILAVDRVTPLAVDALAAPS